MSDVTTDRWAAVEVAVEDPGPDWTGSWDVVLAVDGSTAGYVDLHADGYHAETATVYAEPVGAGPFPTLSEACEWVVDNYEEEVGA